MRQAIETKYLGPTDFRGTRIKATAQAGSVTVSWDHALDVNDNHAKAAEALARKYGWTGTWVAGGLANERGNVYVQVGHGDGFEVAP